MDRGGTGTSQQPIDGQVHPTSAYGPDSYTRCSQRNNDCQWHSTGKDTTGPNPMVQHLDPVKMLHGVGPLTFVRMASNQLI